MYAIDYRVKFILSIYGEEAQAKKIIEELAELQRAIVREDVDNIHEEIADVLIMLEQLMAFEAIDTKKIDEIIESKIERELKRIADRVTGRG